jgi:FixJ family two-component response regulator
MKKGVADFITKPFRKDSILFTIKRVLELARVQKENIELKKKLEG